MKKVQVASAGKTFQFELWQEDGKVYIKRNGSSKVADLVRLGNQRYSLILDGRSIDLGAERLDGSYVISSGSRSGSFMVEDFEVACMKKKAGITDASGLKNVTAPMPGLITQVHCKAGDDVKKNQVILVMEAMKMENDIKSPSAGKIKAVNVGSGDSVDKNQILVEFA